jgi:hypothetical protein
MPNFESGAFNRSATFPLLTYFNAEFGFGRSFYSLNLKVSLRRNRLLTQPWLSSPAHFALL